MSKELETINLLAKKMAVLEERVKNLESILSKQGKMLKEQGVHIVHLKKKTKVKSV
jgi:uncharacterized coiled-coil protein SlyX